MRLGLVLRALEHALLREHHVALGGEVREQVEALEHHADVLAHLVDVGLGVGDLDVLEADLAARRLLEPVDAAQHRRLARARRPQDHDDLALLDLQVDALENLERAEGLPQVLDADDRLRPSATSTRVRRRTACSSGSAVRRDAVLPRRQLRLLAGVSEAACPPSATASLLLEAADPVDERDRDDQVVDGRDHVRRHVAGAAPTMLFAYIISSKTPTAESSAVSLNSRMNSQVIVGSTRLTVCGMITYCIDCAIGHAERATPPRTVPCVIDWMPARKISARYAEQFSASTMTPR